MNEKHEMIAGLRETARMLVHKDLDSWMHFDSFRHMPEMEN